jgi:hypothetical protein
MRTLTRLRINELESGGFLTIIAPCRTSDPNNTMTRIYFGAFQRLAQTGVITVEQLKRISWNVSMTNSEEWRSVLEEFGEEIEIVKIEDEKVLNPDYEAYLADGDLEKFKVGVMGSMSMLLRNPLCEVLEDDERVKEKTIQKLEEILKQLIGDSKDTTFYLDTMVAVIRKK